MFNQSPNSVKPTSFPSSSLTPLAQVAASLLWQPLDSSPYRFQLVSLTSVRLLSNPSPKMLPANLPTPLPHLKSSSAFPSLPSKAQPQSLSNRYRGTEYLCSLIPSTSHPARWSDSQTFSRAHPPSGWDLQVWAHIFSQFPVPSPFYSCSTGWICMVGSYSILETPVLGNHPLGPLASS